MIAEDQLSFLVKERSEVIKVEAELQAAQAEADSIRALLESKSDQELVLSAKLRSIEEARASEKGEVKGRIAALTETVNALKTKNHELEREASEATHRVGLMGGDVSRYTMEVEHLQVCMRQGDRGGRECLLVYHVYHVSLPLILWLYCFACSLVPLITLLCVYMHCQPLISNRLRLTNVLMHLSKLQISTVLSSNSHHFTTSISISISKAELSRTEVTKQQSEAEHRRSLDGHIKERDDAVEKLQKATTQFDAMQSQARDGQAR